MNIASAIVHAALIFLGALFAPLALGQLAPSFPKDDAGKDARAAAKAPLDPVATRARVEQELGRLKEQQERASSGREPPPPPGIGRDEVENARKTRAILVAIYERQLEALAQLEDQRKAREAAEKADREWPGFTEKPPFAILLLDSLREEADNDRAAAGLLKTHRGAGDSEFDRLRGMAQQAAEALRRASEAVESAPAGTDARAAAAWRLEAANGQARLSAEFLVASDLVARAIDAKLAVAELQLRFAERKVAALAGKATIGKADVEEAGRRLETRRAERERELQSLLEANARSRRERDQAEQALEALRAAGSSAKKSPERDRALAEARLRSAEVRVQSEGQQVRILTMLANLYHGMVLESWSWRYSVLAGTDPGVRQEARQRLAGLTEYLGLWESRAATELKEVRATLREQDQRLRLASTPELEKHERNARDALRDLDVALERQHDEVARRLARLGYWQQEFGDSLRARSMSDIGAELLVRVKEIAGQIWNYELFTIEDTVEVGGKTVTTSRGVTVGKSIGAVLLLLLGYRLVGFLSRRVERQAVRRFDLGEEQGKTLRRWVNALGLVALLMVTLNLARIPLTIFAFAGGALAIGIGFGTQTLIKNLISGLLLLVERNIRVGDIIEVEGVTGRVTAVDVRSSTVRAADGVENMIPNSLLLEQKVTNWTLTDAKLRRVVKVGVAYGSPVREVARILAECAERHDAVLKQPAPEVMFEDFGSALMFGVYFWIELTPTANAARIMSDIRFLIEERLVQAGIGIAGAQTDIHLNAARPLKVEVVPPGGAGAEPRAQVAPTSVAIKHGVVP
jgi:small-conductance mechanosensitive channel